MAEDRRARPAGVYLLAAGLLFQGLSGVVGGSALVMDPSGGLVRIPASWLDGSSFSDYLVPGLILLVVLGLFPLLALYGLWTRLLWAWHSALAVGVGLIVWIAVEILIIGYKSSPPLQLGYGLLGIGMLFTALLPSVRTHLGGR